MRQRKNVVNLQSGEIDAFRAAVDGLQKLTDPKANYNHFAQIHVDSCQHGCELFLPWHRAFILDYEDALRRISSTVTLPYWDWIHPPQIPQIFNSPPLAHKRDPGRSGQQLPTLNDVNSTLKKSDFLLFGGGRCPYLPSPGDLENKHGWVHQWVGGDMADIHRSAFDPIFWTHHSNVDRLWAKWQSIYGKDGPSDTTIPLPGLDTHRTIRDVLDIGPNGLGYEYIEDAFEFEIRGPITPRTRHRFDLGRVTSSFRQAQLRLVGLQEAMGSPIPFAIDVRLDGESGTARQSLFGLHPMSYGHLGSIAMAEQPMSLSPILDVTDLISHARGRRQVEMEFDLISSKGVDADTCRIGVERIQLVLLS